MITICNKAQCMACTACMNICPKNAITMKPDACGFMFPVIDQQACVDCGLCVKVCPVNHQPQLESPKECFAVTLNSEEELLSCSSGGAATALSKYVILQGGSVYGCSGEDPRNVHHIRITALQDIDRLKGSKYVQSGLGDIFCQVKEDLSKCPIVLFVGTPCQVAGLRNFLHRDYPNLLTADLVCHGVPSQEMLNDNLRRYCADTERAKIAFRRKNTLLKSPRIEFGWEMQTPKNRIPTFKPYNKDFYMFGFLRCLIFRESCYSCKYAQNKRIGDLTLCDFWGLKPNSGFDIGKGVSAVLVNTKGGAEAWNKIKDQVVWSQREISEATRWNDQLNYPSPKPSGYKRFVYLYGKSSFHTAMVKAYHKQYLYDYYINYKNLLRSFLVKHHII